MYAIIQTGGKQYKVAEGTTLKVEMLSGEPGTAITLDRVLFLGGNGTPKIGTPQLEGASVSAEIVRQGRMKKVLVFKKKRRKGYKKLQGHRQYYTEIKITKIQG